MAKELDLGNSEFTLGKANGEAMRKGVSSVSESKGYPQKFEHSKGSNDSILLNVLGGHRN